MQRGDHRLGIIGQTGIGQRPRAQGGAAMAARLQHEAPRLGELRGDRRHLLRQPEAAVQEEDRDARAALHEGEKSLFVVKAQRVRGQIQPLGHLSTT